MFRPKKKVGLLSGGVITAVSAMTLIGPLMGSAPASATTTNYNFNAVGSDTIFCEDNAVASKYNSAQATKSGNKIYNTPPSLNLGFGCETSPTSYSVPSDSVHGTINYTSTNLPPNGSSAGINALVADNGAGNIAYARSSRGRKSTDASNIDFWAFALDGVTWATQPSSTGGAAPTNLTASQINSIFTCGVTNWDQVGGANAPIKLYYPQTGSGTGSFFATIFLNGNYPTSTSTCPINFVEENDGSQVASADLNDAILPYSFAVYTAQGNSSTGETNLHNGFVLNSVNGVAPSTTTIAETAAFDNITNDNCTDGKQLSGKFCAARYVYHVSDQQLGTNHSDYQTQILKQIGVTQSDQQDTTLSSGLSTSGAITSLPVNALKTSIKKGQSVTLISGGNSQSFKVTASASKGALSISVASTTPNFAYPSGTGVFDVPLDGFCANQYSSTIKLFGFTPLKEATTAESTSSDPVVGSSYCRQF